MLQLLRKSEQALVIEFTIPKIYSANAEDLKLALAPYLKKDIQVYLSLKQVSFMDSSAIGLIISTMRKAIQNNSELFLTDCQASTLALFDLVKLNKVVNIVKSHTELKI